jgi:hypothetical protein
MQQLSLTFWAQAKKKIKITFKTKKWQICVGGCSFLGHRYNPQCSVGSAECLSLSAAADGSRGGWNLFAQRLAQSDSERSRPGKTRVLAVQKIIIERGS